MIATREDAGRSEGIRTKKKKMQKMTEHGKENFEKNMNTEDGVIFKGERM